jgi:hypothetical protein
MPTRKPMTIIVIIIMTGIIVIRDGSLVLHALLVAQERKPV